MDTLTLAGQCVAIEDDDGWTVEFPQYGGMSSSGDTLEEALKAAEDCLKLEALVRLSHGETGVVSEDHVVEVRHMAVTVSEDDAREAQRLSEEKSEEE
ncbi:MAG: hypothetical protein KHY83_06720 [Coriobacteriia bacterium]|nr:hypothetical protein [Coriobacteriia bacterium]MBS5478341.1 hypothetical protein [Coriobacteriia bacterium]